MLEQGRPSNVDLTIKKCRKNSIHLLGFFSTFENSILAVKVLIPLNVSSRDNLRIYPIFLSQINYIILRKVSKRKYNKNLNWKKLNHLSTLLSRNIAVRFLSRICLVMTMSINSAYNFYYEWLTFKYIYAYFHNIEY